MILMALDHARDFFHSSGWDPDFSAGTAVFLTRWITHFCAPAFVFLAGLSAGLALDHGKSVRDLSRFLLTRGLWLTLLDVVVVSYAWLFEIGHPFVTDVLWVIGWSMVILALLVRFHRGVAGTLGLLLVIGHNALDGIHADQLGVTANVWKLLHESSTIQLPWHGEWFVGYPLIPWVGVMALGYAASVVYREQPDTRQRRLLILGAVAIAAFLVLRALNAYGDPVPWSTQATALQTVLSFLSCRKYPPSLLYLLMTLGPVLLALAALDRVTVSARNLLLVFGRAPLFFYIVHLFLLHAVAGLYFFPQLGAAAFHVNPEQPPTGFGLPLYAVYLFCTAVVLALYWPCERFSLLKQRRHSVWLSYL